MIKFILAVIAMIFVGLAAYVYMNPKETHTPVAKAVQKTETSIVKKETPSVQKENVSVKAEVVSEKSSAKNTTVKSPEVVSHETNYKMADTEEIGKGLTLEGIENADVSDEEKERMRDDMMYYHGLHAEPSEPLTKEERLKILSENLKLRMKK